MSAEIPSYAFNPLRRCLDSIFLANRLLHLSVSGLQIISKRPQMVQRVIDLTVAAKQEVTSELKSDLQKAVEDSIFTTNERDNDFPYLHAYTLVGQWAALEAGIEDMLVGLLVNEPKVLDGDAFAKIKLPLAKYELLDKEERMRFLLNDVQRTQSSGTAQGANTFENVLEVFELSGPVEEDIRTNLWEMNHMRNVIVHRDSRADLRLIQACPALKLKVGDRLFVTHDNYAYHANAVIDYIRIIICRLGKRYGAAPPPWALPDGLSQVPIGPFEGRQENS
jgi:hypothetical protein